jgi:hypothetical protein
MRRSSPTKPNIPSNGWGTPSFRLKDLSFRWICVTQFKNVLGKTMEPSEVLATLLGHPAYWFGYISPRYIQPGIHGPYRLDALSVDCFEQVDASTAESILSRWLNQYGPVPADQIEGDLDSIYRLIRGANICVHLPTLGERAQHEVGWILHSGFGELVLIGPANALTLVVASAD